MTDPLIACFVKLLKEDEERELEALTTKGFSSLDQVTLIQGRIQGMRMARSALDSAMRDTDSEKE